jgi:hypothetical protein
MELERLKRAANHLEREIALSRVRFWGNTGLIALMVVLLIQAYSQETLVVMDEEGNALQSHVEDRNDPAVLRIESANHAAMFYSTVWTFDHLNYRQQLDQGLKLGGGKLKVLYKALESRGFYNDIFRNNYEVKSVIDSIPLRQFRVVDGSIHMKVYGRMILKNSFVKETRRLDFDLRIALVARVFVINPHGMSIEDLSITANQTIETETLQ